MVIIQQNFLLHKSFLGNKEAKKETALVEKISPILKKMVNGKEISG